MVRDVIFDTETTGKADFKAPFQAPHQPDLVQLGMQVYEDRELVHEFQCIVNGGFRAVDAEAEAVHGISDAQRVKEGRSAAWVFEYFAGWVQQADRIIAHNLQFDRMIMWILANRLKSYALKGNKLTTNGLCTMRIATPVCGIRGPRGLKWPTLQEAYKHLVDPKGFEGAHDAMVDVRACAAIFYALEKGGHL